MGGWVIKNAIGYNWCVFVVEVSIQGTTVFRCKRKYGMMILGAVKPASSGSNAEK